MFLASEFRYVTKRIGLWCNAYGDITDFENWISQKHKILDISRTKRYFFLKKKKKKEKSINYTSRATLWQKMVL